jgi:hypothetical protein
MSAQLITVLPSRIAMPGTFPARMAASGQPRYAFSCIVLAGRYPVAEGPGDQGAVTLLGQADSGSAKHLRVLLNMKTKASYGHTEPTAADAKRAGRAAEALVETARRVNNRCRRTRSAGLWPPAVTLALRGPRPSPVFTQLARAAGSQAERQDQAISRQAESGTTSGPRMHQDHGQSHARPRRHQEAGQRLPLPGHYDA